jgi:photosystem II stability/assembly factor-like uncharacterized protein
MLLLATNDGVFRWANGDGDRVTDRTLNGGGGLTCPRVRSLRTACYAATERGLYRSTDGGATWRNCEVPTEPVYSVAESPAGQGGADDAHLYAGTFPVHVYRREDAGGSWTELEGIREVPSAATWSTPRHDDAAQVRALRTHPDAPDRLVAGIEAGGVHVSDDLGETWQDRADGVHPDIHDLHLRGPDEFLAATGFGLCRTTDGGRTWARIDPATDTGLDLRETGGDPARLGVGGDTTPRRYFRAATSHEGRLYAAAATGPTGTWVGERGADAALYESEDDGETWTAVEYPGGPVEFVLTFARDSEAGRVLAGTDRGRVLAREPDGWTELTRVPACIRSLAVVV